MVTDTGRSPSGRAGRASPEPASSLGHTATIPNAAWERSFDDWYYEIENWSFRCERAVEDLDTDPRRLASWLQAAFQTGFEAALEYAAHTAEHLNGWGNPPAPELADHIARVIRSASSAQAIEARQGGDGETRLHPKDESAVGNADAPKG